MKLTKKEEKELIRLSVEMSYTPELLTKENYMKIYKLLNHKDYQIFEAKLGNMKERKDEN